MKKLRFEKASDARHRNALEAENRNCDMITTYQWWSVAKDEKGFYIEIPEADIEQLPMEEQELLED